MSPRVALIAALLTACGVDAHVAREQASIVKGTVDTADPAVVAIAVRRTGCTDRPPTPTCSGTLIHPRVVLTAAHCLEPEAAGVSYEVLFGASNTAAGVTLRVVTGELRHPKYDSKTHAYDVAVLRLADPAPVPPVSLAITPPATGDLLRVVGFGTTEDPKIAPGTKRSGTMIVTVVEEAGFRADPSPANTCQGDSGGPVFSGTPELLIGVTASGDPGCRQYAFNVRVDAIRPLIEDFIKETETTPTGPPSGAMSPEQVCSVPCAKHGDCPASLRCQVTPTGSRCVLPGLVPGDFGAQCGPGRKACASGSACARLWPDGDFACLCHTPCPGSVVPPTDAGPLPPSSAKVRAYGGGTCGTSHERDPATSASGAWLVMTAAMLAWISRSLSRRAPDPLCSGCRASSRGVPRGA